MMTYIKKLLTPKGAYGYLENLKVYTALRTVLFFLFCVGLYLIGCLITGTNRNLLTVVAILLCLPACKSAVNFIIFIKTKGCSASLRERVRGYDEALETMYDMYFTSYQRNYPISHLAVKGNIICGITENPKCDCREAEKHLSQMLTQEGIKNVTVNIFSETDKYVDRLGRLSDLDVDSDKNKEGILRLLYSISL